MDTLEPTIQEESDEHWIDEEAEEVPYEPFFFQSLNYGLNEHHFLPHDHQDQASAEGQQEQNAVAGPEPSTAANAILQRAQNTPSDQDRLLVDQQHARVTFWNEEVGHIIRRVAPPLHSAHYIRDKQGDVEMAEGDPTFFPFSSELDWKIA